MKKRKSGKPTIPFGKFAGFSLRHVLKAEPSYLAWFEQNIEGEDELKTMIRALPEFPAILVAYLHKKCRKAGLEVAEPIVDEAELDDLCDQLFNGATE